MPRAKVGKRKKQTQQQQQQSSKDDNGQMHPTSSSSAIASNSKKKFDTTTTVNNNTTTEIKAMFRLFDMTTIILSYLAGIGTILYYTHHSTPLVFRRFDNDSSTSPSPPLTPTVDIDNNDLLTTTNETTTTNIITPLPPLPPNHTTCSPPPLNPPSCKLYLAPSTIPHSGLGIFSSTPLPPHTPLGHPDIVIHITDPPLTSHHYSSLRLLIDDYTWRGEDMSGQYEGLFVSAAVPGVGSAANGDVGYYNVRPGATRVGSGGVERGEQPMAGGMSHYHDLSFWTTKEVGEGEEIFANYGNEWFQRKVTEGRGGMMVRGEALGRERRRRSVDWLREEGRCMDNVRVGLSLEEGAGRGGFAVRDLRMGSVVMPMPVVVIGDKRALTMKRWKTVVDENGTSRDVLVETEQLLVNYCYGHVNSSVLFFPYGAGVSLVNHSSKRPNVSLRWSNMTIYDNTLPGHERLSIQELKKTPPNAGLLLEFVALRDIDKGEEILFDYGESWERAWRAHVEGWTPPESSKPYINANDFNRTEKVIRTMEEQRVKPYDENMFTSCYYIYDPNQNKQHPSSSSPNQPIRWNGTQKTFNSDKLRPCFILRRDLRHQGTYQYTAQIGNRPGMQKSQIIPKHSKHIVTGIPRRAITFSNKLYTTDQHLERAFRKEIGIPDEIFPKGWMDLVAGGGGGVEREEEETRLKSF